MMPSPQTLALALLAGAIVIGAVTWCARCRRLRQLEHGFWSPLLAPLAPLHGAALLRAVTRVCEQPHRHPVRGPVRLRPPEVLVRLAAAPVEDRPREPPLAPFERAGAEPTLLPGGVRSGRTSEQVAEDVFWLDLLTPLVELNKAETEQALAELADEPQIHPLEGLRVFDARTFRERLEWVRLTDVRKVTQRWETAGRRPNPISKSAGSGPGRRRA